MMNRASAVFLLILLGANAFSSSRLPLSKVTASTTYYVSTGGNDLNPGSILLPFRTIRKVTGLVKPGDSVYIRGGIYHESNTFYTDGAEEAPILISGYAGETAIIDGSSYTIPAKASGMALLQVYGDWYIIRDLTVTGSGDQGVTTHGIHDTIDNVYSHHNWGWGILMTGNDNVTQNSRVWSNSMMNEAHSLNANWSGGVTCARYPDHCTIRTTRSWENWGEGISTFESLHTIIEANIAYDNDTNIYISDTKYALVSGNLIYCTAGNLSDANQQQNGILVYEELGVPIPLGPGGVRQSSSNNSFFNNVLHGCDNNLFATAAQAANNVYAYNTFVNSDTNHQGYNANVQFVAGSAPNQQFINNLVYQNDSIAILQVDTPGVITFSHNLWSKAPLASFKASGPGDVIGDPKLAMEGAAFTPGWYRLTALSPAINAGESIPEVLVDFSRFPRGLAPDIGAFEYHVTPLEFLYLPYILKYSPSNLIPLDTIP